MPSPVLHYGATDSNGKAVVVEPPQVIAEEDVEAADAHCQQRMRLLLQPSAHSTDRPVSLMYPSAESTDYEEEESNRMVDPRAPLIQMSVSNSNLQANNREDQDLVLSPKTTGKYSYWHRNPITRKSNLYIPIALVLLVLMMGGVLYRPIQQQIASYNVGHTMKTARPLSKLDPVLDLGIPSFTRPEESGPNRDLFPKMGTDEKEVTTNAVPTNAWFQNLLLLPKGENQPKLEQRVYPIPYLIDLVGPVPGIRVMLPALFAGAQEVHVAANEQFGLTLGAAPLQYWNAKTNHGDDDKGLSHQYNITHMTSLGITLEWNQDDNGLLTYSSTIVRGMPYGTVHYQFKGPSKQHQDDSWVPTVVSEQTLKHPPKVDGRETELDCSVDSKHNGKFVPVKRELQLEFAQDDSTWLLFVSRRVLVRCRQTAGQMALQFSMDHDDDQDDNELVLRAALLDDCTSGTNPITCANNKKKDRVHVLEDGQLLRDHAQWYPGPNTNVLFDYDHDDLVGNDGKVMAPRLTFDWDVQSMSSSSGGGGGEQEGDTSASLLMYALPHHQDIIVTDEQESAACFVPTRASSGDRFCQPSLIGPACAVEGSSWTLAEQGVTTASFWAPRHPKDSALPELIRAYRQDLKFTLPKYYQVGAGDTCFSGKMLAKMARILTIGEELYEICSKSLAPTECETETLPSPDEPEFQNAVARLREGVEIWINGNAITPFVYDKLWGGLVSCGCDFDGDRGACRNRFPHCPGFADPGLNFGNAFYNDHHFHYGYHVYAAAAVAHFDQAWGRSNFQQVLLLIRDFANPSKDDSFFPTARHKDWYQGNSWANGIATANLNGRNQESSSEAIAAYEAVELYGLEMQLAWKDYDKEQAQAARQIKNFGQLLKASELRSADRYWHVVDGRRQFPEQYTPHVFGMVWSMLAQFQTWFGSAPHLVYGIQLLPLTSVSEQRDDVQWVRELFHSFAESCEANRKDCEDQGWSVLVFAMLATVGHPEEAAQKALQLPLEVFESAGGNGHSLTNSLWYFATRKELDDPLDIRTTAAPKHTSMTAGEPASDQEFTDSFNCGCPDTCTKDALNRLASDHSCGDRIQWLMTAMHKSEADACTQVGGAEYPDDCGSCDPKKCKYAAGGHEGGSTASHGSNPDSHGHNENNNCPPCSREICQGKLNKCPVRQAPFLCLEGPGAGGCSMTPWVLTKEVCISCCALSNKCID